MKFACAEASDASAIETRPASADPAIAVAETDRDADAGHANRLRASDVTDPTGS